MIVRRVTAEDVPAVSAALARAFEDDPLMSWVVRNDATRVAKLTAVTIASLRRTLVKDTMDCFTSDDRAGLAMWGRPGAWDVPSNVMLPVLPRLLWSFGIGGAGRLGRAMSALRKAHPEQPHWYLAGLGTDPPKQGTGVGAALVRVVLERCDTDGLPAYLETQKAANVPFYEKLGFRVTKELDIPGNGPHMWLMWRDPQ